VYAYLDFPLFPEGFRMTHFFKICRFVVVLSLVPIFSALGGETIQELPGKALEATTVSTGSHIFEGKLLKMIEEEFWMVEDMASNLDRIHMGSETTLSQSPKQPGDSIQTVVKKNGHAL
jgi:hypothetical protein